MMVNGYDFLSRQQKIRTISVGKELLQPETRICLMCARIELNGNMTFLSSPKIAEDRLFNGIVDAEPSQG